MEPDELDHLYRDDILDHCRHPRNSAVVESPDISASAVNPFCGDEVSLQAVLEDGCISRTGVQGRGCAINQASASMLSEAISSKTVEETEALAERFRRMMRGETEAEQEDLGTLGALAEVRQFPVRIKCALLAWSALEEGIEDFRREPAV